MLVIDLFLQIEVPGKINSIAPAVADAKLL